MPLLSCAGVDLTASPIASSALPILQVLVASSNPWPYVQLMEKGLAERVDPLLAQRLLTITSEWWAQPLIVIGALAASPEASGLKMRNHRPITIQPIPFYPQPHSNRNHLSSESSLNQNRHHLATIRRRKAKI
jgi:hypothetical protein